jgi:hypothetical protein
MNSTATAVSVAGSFGSTSYKKERSTRENTSAPARPAATPPAIRRRPSERMSVRISRHSAPIAVRMAISWRREATESDSTP